MGFPRPTILQSGHTGWKHYEDREENGVSESFHYETEVVGFLRLNGQVISLVTIEKKRGEQGSFLPLTRGPRRRGGEIPPRRKDVLVTPVPYWTRSAGGVRLVSQNPPVLSETSLFGLSGSTSDTSS